MLGMTDTEEPLQRHKDSGEDGDGEADLGEGKDEGDDVGNNDQFKVLGNVGGRENKD